MKHTRSSVAGATAVLAVSLAGLISATPASAQGAARISSAQLHASLQQAVAREQANQVTLSCCPAGTPAMEQAL